MMAYLCSLLLIAILTVASGATPLYCSDVQSPAGGSGHNTDLSQVTALQYCIIDNCTIMRIDTGQQLDIIYTTESLLIVTPKDGRTSMVIAKLGDELPCLGYPNTTVHSLAIFELILASLVIMVTAYILIVELLLKKFHALFGKLLICYNLALLCASGPVVTIMLTHYYITVNSQTVCYSIMFLYTMASTSSEIFATNLLSYLAYLMYRCYHLKSEISKKTSQFLLRCYTAYAGFTLVLLFFVTIAYDWRNGNAKYTILANGHCNHIDYSTYNTLFFSHSIVGINKFLQTVMFSAYLVYYYKFNLNVRAAQISLQYNRHLVNIAIAMGASVGLAYFIFTILVILGYSHVAFMSGGILLIIQQIVIMTSYISIKKIFGLCKEYFSRE